MYDPYGRYRYWNGIVCQNNSRLLGTKLHCWLVFNALQNWRAAVAMLFSITPTLPGLINNINPKIFIGNAALLFNIAWLYGVRIGILRFLWFWADSALQFFSASAVYLVLSKAFPAHETFLEEAILGDDFGLNTPTEESPAPSAGDEKEKANVLAKHVDWASIKLIMRVKIDDSFEMPRRSLSNWVLL